MNYSTEDNNQQRFDSASCQHNKTVHFKDKENCLSCGVYIPKNNIEAFKSIKQNYGAFFSPYRFYQSMFKHRLEKFTLKLNPYLQHRRQQIDQIFEVAEKLKLSLKTIHLGIYFLDYVIYKDQKALKLMQLYSTMCLLTAAKAIEKDERIPFLSKLRSLTAPIYSIDDFRRTENSILETLQFNVQQCTILEVIEFFLSQGILFSSDVIIQENNCNNYCDRDRKGDSSEIAKVNSVGTVSLIQNKFGSDYSQSETTNDSDKYSINTSTLSNNGQHSSSTQGNKSIERNESKTSLIQQSRPVTKQNQPDLVQKMERDGIRIANALIKDENYLEFDEKLLAASAIAFIRKTNKISPIWNKDLKSISGFDETEVLHSLDLLMSRFESILLGIYSPNNSGYYQSQYVSSGLQLNQQISYPLQSSQYQIPSSLQQQSQPIVLKKIDQNVIVNKHKYSISSIMDIGCCENKREKSIDQFCTQLQQQQQPIQQSNLQNYYYLQNLKSQIAAPAQPMQPQQDYNEQAKSRKISTYTSSTTSQQQNLYTSNLTGFKDKYDFSSNGNNFQTNNNSHYIPFSSYRQQSMLYNNQYLQESNNRKFI